MLRRCSLAFALALVALAAGCKSDLKGSLAEGKQGMESSADNAIRDLLEERAGTIGKLWEEHERAVGGPHWLLSFGPGVVKDGLVDRARALIETHERSARAEDFKRIWDFLFEQDKYWKNPTGALNDYMAYLDKWIANTKDAKAPFLDHVRFERELLHAVHFEQSKKYDEDTQLTSFYRFWKFAFEFPPEDQEPFLTYVNRLCAQKLKDYCAPLMWEHRPYAMKKPYVEALVANMEKFRKDFPDSAYDPIAKALLERYLVEPKSVPQFEEYPKLPEGRTARDAVGGDELVFGTKGVTWKGVNLYATTDGKMSLDAKKGAAAAKKLDETLKKVLEEAAVELDEPTIDFALTLADATTPLVAVAPGIWTLLEDKVTELGFLARRRADGTNRKVGTYLATYWTPWPPNEDIESRKTKEERKKDEEGRLEHDPRRKMPPEVAGMTCRAIGRTGKIMAETLQPTAYLAIGPKDAAVGAVEAPESYVTETARAAAPTAERPAKEALADLAWFKSWADGLAGPAVLAVHTSWTYADLIQALHGVLVTCSDAACTDAADRDIQLTLMLCE